MNATVTTGRIDLANEALQQRIAAAWEAETGKRLRMWSRGHLAGTWTAHDENSTLTIFPEGAAFGKFWEFGEERTPDPYEADGLKSIHRVLRDAAEALARVRAALEETP